MSDVDAEGWHARWREGRIGFHEGAPNAFLLAYADRLGPPPGRILVPLCGKAEDLAWLARRGHPVAGVELSPIAALAFFEEHRLSPERARRGEFEVFSAGGVEIWVGDLFALEAALLGPVAAAYDRAALVALPPSEQPRYAAHLVGLLPPGAPCLLVTFDYDAAKLQGPPFPVPASAVRAAYGPRCEVTLLEERVLAEERPRFKEAGLDQVKEAAWLLRVRQAAEGSAG